MLKKEEVYLNLGNSEEIKEIASILKDAKEAVYNMKDLAKGFSDGYTTIHCDTDGEWTRSLDNGKRLITIDLLKAVLNVNKFKVGDMVRIINSAESGHPLGTIGVILSIDRYSGCRITYNNQDWVHSQRNLELVTEPTQTVIRKALAEIYPDVCIEWQKRIDTILLANKFRDEFEVSNSLVGLAYDEMVKDVQRDWLKKHLPKPKKMVTKEVVYYLNIISDDITLKYLTKQEALDDKYRCDEVIARAVKLTGTYQIKE